MEKLWTSYISNPSDLSITTRSRFYFSSPWQKPFQKTTISFTCISVFRTYLQRMKSTYIQWRVAIMLLENLKVTPIDSSLVQIFGKKRCIINSFDETWNVETVRLDNVSRFFVFLGVASMSRCPINDRRYCLQCKNLGSPFQTLLMSSFLRRPCWCRNLRVFRRSPLQNFLSVIEDLKTPTKNFGEIIIWSHNLGNGK